MNEIDVTKQDENLAKAEGQSSQQDQTEKGTAETSSSTTTQETQGMRTRSRDGMHTRSQDRPAGYKPKYPKFSDDEEETQTNSRSGSKPRGSRKKASKTASKKASKKTSSKGRKKASKKQEEPQQADEASAKASDDMQTDEGAKNEGAKNEGAKDEGAKDDGAKDETDASTGHKRKTTEDASKSSADGDDKMQGKEKEEQGGDKDPQEDAASQQSGAKQEGKKETAAEATETSAPSAKKAKTEHQVLETGHIYWFYRPKIDVETPHDLSEIQKLYMLLCPLGATSSSSSSSAGDGAQAGSGDNSTAFHRLFIVPSKRMPQPMHSGHRGRGAMNWAFVDMVGKDLTEIDEELGRGEKYMTKTRGERQQQSCRPVGEGVYELIHSADDKTYLAYILEVPKEPGWPQNELGILKEERVLLQVKNPYRAGEESRTGARAGFSSKHAAEFPDEIQELFKGKRVAERKFITPNRIEFFNTPHAEFVMIGAAADLSKFDDVGLKLAQLEMTEEREIAEEYGDEPEKKIFSDLGLSQQDMPADAVKADPKWA